MFAEYLTKSNTASLSSDWANIIVISGAPDGVSTTMELVTAEASLHGW